MLKMQFRQLSGTANTFRQDRLAEGHVVRFDVGHGDNNTLDIIVKDDNNDMGQIWPYTIRFVVKTNYKNGEVTIRPIVNQRFVADWGNVGREKVVSLFRSQLFSQMRKHW